MGGIQNRPLAELHHRLINKDPEHKAGGGKETTDFSRDEFRDARVPLEEGWGIPETRTRAKVGCWSAGSPLSRLSYPEESRLFSSLPSPWAPPSPEPSSPGGAAREGASGVGGTGPKSGSAMADFLEQQCRSWPEAEG